MNLEKERAKKIRHTVYPSGVDSHGISTPKTVERTRKELDTSMVYHNAKRHHGTDINGVVYQIPVSRKFNENYDNIKWDRDGNSN